MIKLLGELKQLKLWKNKFFLIILMIEICLLLYLSLGLFGKSGLVKSLSRDDFSQSDASFNEEQQGFYIDTVTGQKEAFIKSDDISLNRGVYRVNVRYQTNYGGITSSSCLVEATDVSYNGLFVNEISLLKSQVNTAFPIWLLEDTKKLTVTVNYSGEGSLLISGIDIYSTNILNRIELIIVFMLSFLFDTFLISYYYNKKHNISSRNKNITWGLFLIIIFSSLPIMTNYVIMGDDCAYHLLRIEGVAAGLRSGQFPVRLSAYWLGGYGYPSSIMYCDIFLYIPAILRLIGFPVQVSYNIYIFLVNIATCLVSYFCFKKIFKDNYIGLFGSLLYTFSIYRINNIYIRSALGEYTAMIFLPIIVLGFYKIYTEDKEDKKYRYNWLLPVIGFSGIIQSHIISCEIVGIFTIVLCLLLWKKTFRIKTFWVLVKTVVFTLLVNAWFLIPFFDYSINEKLSVFKNNELIQSKGIYLAHILYTFFSKGESSDYNLNGMRNGVATGLGIGLVIGFFGFLYILTMINKDKIDRNYLVLGKVAMGLGTLGVVMSLIYFPWDQIQNLGGFMGTLVSSIQFPWRFLTVATIMMTIVCCVAVKINAKMENQSFKLIFVGIIVFTTILSCLYLENDILYKSTGIRIYNAESMGSFSIGRGEYLPEGTDFNLLSNFSPVSSENVMVSQYSKKNNKVTFCVEDNKTISNEENSFDYETYVEVPLLYYKGYIARDVSTGQKIEIVPGDNQVVRVLIPAGFNGKVVIDFECVWYWTFALVLSIITDLIIFVSIVVSVVKKIRNNKRMSGR